MMFVCRTKDLDEVLQIHSVFLNVSKGQVAKEADLQTAFGHADVERVILEILAKGEVQVGAEERTQQLQMLTREVATIIADKCINPRTRTPYPVGMIEQALAEIHFSPNLTKGAKQQALETIKLLEKESKLPIARAQMRLQVEVSPGAEERRVMDAIRPLIASIEDTGIGGDTTAGDVAVVRIICLIDPGQYRPIIDAVSKLTKGKGMVTLLSLRDMREAPLSSTGPSPAPPKPLTDNS